MGESGASERLSLRLPLPRDRHQCEKLITLARRSVQTQTAHTKAGSVPEDFSLGEEHSRGTTRPGLFGPELTGWSRPKSCVPPPPVSDRIVRYAPSRCTSAWCDSSPPLRGSTSITTNRDGPSASPMFASGQRVHQQRIVLTLVVARQSQLLMRGCLPPSRPQSPPHEHTPCAFTECMGKT